MSPFWLKWPWSIGSYRKKSPLFALEISFFVAMSGGKLPLTSRRERDDWEGQGGRGPHPWWELRPIWHFRVLWERGRSGSNQCSAAECSLGLGQLPGERRPWDAARVELVDMDKVTEKKEDVPSPKSSEPDWEMADPIPVTDMGKRRPRFRLWRTSLRIWQSTSRLSRWRPHRDYGWSTRTTTWPTGTAGDGLFKEEPGFWHHLPTGQGCTNWHPDHRTKGCFCCWWVLYLSVSPWDFSRDLLTFSFRLEACWKAGICLQCTLEQNVSILAQVTLIYWIIQEEPTHHSLFRAWRQNHLRDLLRRSQRPSRRILINSTDQSKFFWSKQIPWITQAHMARDGYTTLEDLACRWTTAELARTQSPTDLKFKDGEWFWPAKFKFHSDEDIPSGDAGKAHVPIWPGHRRNDTRARGPHDIQSGCSLWQSTLHPSILCQPTEEGERPTKSHRKFTVDGFEKEEEEEERPNPLTRRQLERMHTVFRNNLLMCTLAFPQFQQFDVDEWPRWMVWLIGFMGQELRAESLLPLRLPS